MAWWTTPQIVAFAAGLFVAIVGWGLRMSGYSNRPVGNAVMVFGASGLLATLTWALTELPAPGLVIIGVLMLLGSILTFEGSRKREKRRAAEDALGLGAVPDEAERIGRIKESAGLLAQRLHPSRRVAERHVPEVREALLFLDDMEGRLAHRPRLVRAVRDFLAQLGLLLPESRGDEDRDPLTGHHPVFTTRAERDVAVQRVATVRDEVYAACDELLDLDRK